MIGKTISRYRILKELGRGGMGVVYVGEDTRLGRKVALKVLSPDLTADAERVQRFIREAQAASVINHPNIATVYEIDEADGTTFIAMEFIDGKTLRQCMSGMSFTDILDASHQLAAGLAKAHELGIVHRDIKPDNIMIRPDGILKILDFGLAKLLDTGESPDSTGVMDLTQAGAVMGTARYMSPEQAQGRSIDARSDVFSVGAVLYEMVVGRPAFPGESRYEILYAVVNKPPDPILDGAGVHPKLRHIIAKALAKSPSDRYPDCGAMLESLKGVSASDAPSIAPVSAVDRTWAAATGVVTVMEERTDLPSHSVAVLPFRNLGSPDAGWMSTGLQMMLTSDLAHVASLRVVSPDRLTTLLSDLKLGQDATFDEATVKTISEFLSVDTVITGNFIKLGPASRVDATVTRPSAGQQTLVKAEAKDDAGMLELVAHLAAEVLRTIEEERRDLLVTMVGESGSRNPEALKSYVDGLSQLHQGGNLEAIALLKQAIAADPEYAMAYTYLGAALSNMGKDDEAEASLRKAVELSTNLERTDRLFISAREAMATGEIRRAIESFEHLTGLLPNDLGAYYELALAYEMEGEWERATSKLERVIDLDPKFAAALFALGRVHIKEGSCDKALEYLHRALSLHVLVGNDEGRATVLNAIGLAHYFLDRYDEALKYYEDSLEIKKSIGDERGSSATLSNMAVVYQTRGDYERSISTYGEALGISEALGDKHGVAENLINLGTVQEEQGHLDDALGSYKKALKIESELGDRMAEVLCLNDIGNIYITQGKVDDAEVYLDRALDARRRLGEKKGIIISLNYLGNIERLRGQYDKATARHLEALSTSREIKWRSGEAETLGNIALVMMGRGRYGAALESQREAEAIFDELGDKKGIAVAVAARAELECALGHCSEARETAHRGKGLAHEIDDDALIAAALLSDARIALMDGRAAEAVESLLAAREHAGATGAQVTLLKVGCGLGCALREAGRSEEAVEMLDTVIADARRLGLEVILANAEWCRGNALLAAGRDEDARRAASTAVAVADSTGDQGLAIISHALAVRAAESTDRDSDHGATIGHARSAIEAAIAIATELGDQSERFLKRPDIAEALKGALAVASRAGDDDLLKRLAELGCEIQ